MGLDQFSGKHQLTQKFVIQSESPFLRQIVMEFLSGGGGTTENRVFFSKIRSEAVSIGAGSLTLKFPKMSLGNVNPWLIYRGGVPF